MSDPLWAPWRMDYILGPKADECIFCVFPARETHRSDLVLAVTPHAFVVLNRYPFAAGHLLVVPRRHVADLGDLTDDEADALFRMLRFTVARLRESTAPQGINVGFNLGKAAGAGLADHLHAHVVPRWEGDTNFMPVLGGVRVMPEHLDATWLRLSPHFARTAA